MRWVVIAVAVAGAIRAEAGEPAVRIAPDGGDPVRVVVSCAAPPGATTGTVEESVGRRQLTLSLVDEAGAAGPPIFGSYAVKDERLTFRPQFGLARGATYRARSGDATVEYRVPTLDGAEPAVVRLITPTADRLPANVLRFYVTFSRPMREGREVLERIRLLDEAGREIATPWRELELWNADATRLSLFLHPGRIKQSVNLRVQLGPLLEPGRKYVLVVGADLLDARGVPLGREFRKEFTTSDERREPIDVSRWRFTSPTAAKHDALTIDFDRPLDAALAIRCLRVRDAAGTEIVGRAELAAGERRWTFTPAAPWKSEAYSLDVDPVLEDVCGNTPLRAFDVDLDAREAAVPTNPLLRRTFTPR